MPLRVWIHPISQTGLEKALSPRVVEVASLGDGIIFGRARGVTIELPFPAISGRHARVFPRDGLLFLEDFASTNGTWLGDRRLVPGVPIPIANGEVIRIANIQIRMEGSPDGHFKDLTHPEANESLARRLVADLFSAGPPAEPTALFIEVGPDIGKTLAFLVTGRRYVVGRGATCDWVLNDEDMSREHAEFVRTIDGIRVRDVGSKNGLFLGQGRVLGEVSLHDGDRVRMGHTCFLVQDPEDRYLRQMEQVEGREASPTSGDEEGKVEPLPSLQPAVAAAKTSVLIQADLASPIAPTPPSKIEPSRPTRSRLPLYATVVAGMIFFGILILSFMLAFGYWK